MAEQIDIDYELYIHILTFSLHWPFRKLCKKIYISGNKHFSFHHSTTINSQCKNLTSIHITRICQSPDNIMIICNNFNSLKFVGNKKRSSKIRRVRSHHQFSNFVGKRNYRHKNAECVASQLRCTGNRQGVFVTIVSFADEAAKLTECTHTAYF